MRFHIKSQLSAKMAKTPEGFLVCRDVPIGRTGVMEYSPQEVPIDAPGGIARIQRDEDEVFAPECLASFEGKPVTIDHPEADVTPETWNSVAKGHAQNVRRGEGVNAGHILADLVIMNPDAIKLVRGGLREISCGYDADYEQTGPGAGRQRNIRGNHIALVHRGRCGPTCRINDTQEDNMREKQSFADRFLGLFKTPEARKMLDALDEEQPEEPKQDPPATDEEPDRLAALENQVAELTVAVRQLADAANPAPADDAEPEPESEPEPSEDEGADKPSEATDQARDAARTVDADTIARAEVLYPGMQVVDSDKDCAVKRLAIRTATSRDTSVKRLVDGMLRGTALDSCDCVTLDGAFLAASELVKAQKNNKTSDTLLSAKARDFGKAKSPADINQMNREYHAKGGK